MHVVQRPVRQRRQKRMYLPSERMVVNGVGLGELDGMFNIGKMFTRMFTFTPSSFKLKNIAGTIGSAVTTFGTFGIANVASEVLGSSGLKVVKGGFTSTHSKPMQYVGYGTMAAAAAAGAYFGGSALLSKAGTISSATGTGLATTAGTAAQGTGIGVASTAASTGGGFLSTVGNALSTAGSGLMTVMKALPVIGGMLGGGGGGGGAQQQQVQEQAGGMTQAQYDAQQQALYEASQRQQQEAYAQQVAAQQAQIGMPISYGGGGGGEQPSMQTSYGDLRSPYTAVTENGGQVQIDPATGNVVLPEPGMSTEMMAGIAVVVLGAGWYFLSDSK